MLPGLAPPLLLASPSGLDVSKLFSTDLWVGNSLTQTIVNGLNLSGDGGAVYIFNRSFGDGNIYDTERGVRIQLLTDNIGAETTDFNSLTAFNSNGFSIGSANALNANANNIVGYSFKKAPRFFDVKAFTQSGSSPITVTHNLGVVPGMVILKWRQGSQQWPTSNIALDVASSYSNTFRLSGDDASNAAGMWQVAPTSTQVTFGGAIVASSGNYIAYFFAHDTAADSVIKCGSYVGNGSVSGPSITTGFKPQFLMIKADQAARNWAIFDSKRSVSNPRTLYVRPNLGSGEQTLASAVNFNASGFSIGTTNTLLNASGVTYYYVAIKDPN